MKQIWNSYDNNIGSYLWRKNKREIDLNGRLTELTDGGGYPAYGLIAAAAAAANAGLYLK